MTVTYNVNIVGNLTNNQGILSGFSLGNYATLPLNFSPSQQSYEIVFKFNSNNISDKQIILQIGNVSIVSGLLDIEIYNSKLYFEFDSESVQRCYIEGITTLLSNTDYWVKVAYDGISEYNLYYSTDGSTWNIEGITTSNYYLGSTQNSYIGIDQSLTTGYFNGSIDLNECYIKIDNNYFWQGITSTPDVITRIQLRHDTAANWTIVNPILLVGEVGIETDTLKQKVGDGSTAWNSLAYAIDMSTKQDTLVSGTNIKTINNTSLLGSGNIDTTQIFFAVYDMTTANQINQALASGKAIFCTKGGTHIYSYSGRATLDGLSVFTFSRVYQNTTEVVYVSSITNEWNTITKTLANDNLSNVTSIDANSAVQTALDNKANTTLSNVSSIDSSSAVSTALDAKVNKSGDTMTGGLTVQDNHIIIESPDAWDSTPSEQIETGVEFNNNNGDRLGYVNCVYATNGARLARLNTRNADGSANTYIEVGYNSSGNAYCTFPNTTCVDGQWVSSSQTIISSATSLNGSTNLTYTVQVPDDGHVYEVLVRGEVETGTTSGNFCILSIQSNQLTSDWCYVAGARTRTSSGNNGYGSIIIPIKRANNNLTVRRSSYYQGSVPANGLVMLAYRRVGTNS